MWVTFLARKTSLRGPQREWNSTMGISNRKRTQRGKNLSCWKDWKSPKSRNRLNAGLKEMKGKAKTPWRGRQSSKEKDRIPLEKGLQITKELRANQKIADNRQTLHGSQPEWLETYGGIRSLYWKGNRPGRGNPEKPQMQIFPKYFPVGMREITNIPKCL